MTGAVRPISASILLGLLAFATSCSGPVSYSKVDETAETQPLSREYCDEMVELLDKFDEILYANYVGDENLSGELVYTARQISGLVRRAEFEGVNLRSNEALWFKKLQTGARAFVLLAESEEGEFSQEELEAYLGQIDSIFSNARGECVGRKS